MLIFGGPKAYEDRCHQKLTHCRIYATAPMIPVYLRWLERSITFGTDDHLDHIVEAGRFPLVASAVVEGVRMTRVLMDGGNSINIIYKDAFKRLNIDMSKLCPSHSPFHGIILRHQVMPLGATVLSITFGDQEHYRKEILSFEVVDFEGLTMPSLGGRATPSSWWSPTMPTSSLRCWDHEVLSP